MLFSGVQHFLLALASSVALNALVVEGTLGSRKVDTVYAPRITYPTAGTTWTSGGPGSCVWETDGIPPPLRNSTGTIYLGYQETEDGGEHLATDRPLSESFPITKGCANFTVPAGLPTRRDYIVVLLGDSGNASPKFTIECGAHNELPHGPDGVGGAGATEE